MSPAEIIRVKKILPTSLGSDEIRERYAREILARSVFSARMESAYYLRKVREVCELILNGEISQAEARARLLPVLEQLGHSPTDPGGLKNHASIRRLNLILSTQTSMAASVARVASQTDGILYQFPAWRLTRLEARAVPREDWPARWRAAGASVNFEGAIKNDFIALKSSPIWQALGDGVGGFSDALGNPYPPFAYSSGLDWVDVPRATCIKLGLITADDDGSARMAAVPSLSPTEEQIADAIDRYGFPSIAEDIA